MNAFDLLTALNVLVLVYALARLRPTTLIIAANQVLVLLALGNIERYGGPSSQAFVPESVFSSENLAVARNIFTISTTCLLLVMLLPVRRPLATARPLPVPPRWLLGLTLVYFLLVIITQASVVSTGYGEAERTGINLGGGIHAILGSLFLYEMVRRARAGKLRRLTAFALVLGLFVATDYLKGGTGLATGYVLTAAVLIFSGEPNWLRRVATVSGLLLSLSLFALAVRSVRATFHREGGAAFSKFVDRLQVAQEERSQRGEGVESLGNGAQYAAHVLECITLYESNISRQWRSVYLPFVYTFQPSFALAPLGIVRPREAAWELGDYFIGGGGIFVLGELYWNGGYLCVILVFAFIALLAWRCDTAYPTSFVWLIMACNFAPNLLQGMGYGFAQASRGGFNGLEMLLAWRVWHALFRRRMAHVPSEHRAAV